MSDQTLDTSRGELTHADIGPIRWVTNSRDAALLKEEMWTSSAIVFDLETTGLQEYAYHGGPQNGGVAARVSLATFTLPQADAVGEWDGREPTSWVVPLSHPDSTFLGNWRGLLGELMQEAKKSRSPVVGQNVKFDSRWVYATTSTDVSSHLAWDTRISSHLLDENRRTSLKKRAPETFGIPPWDDHDLSYPGASEDVPLWELGEYGARDTYWTWKLYEAHREEMFLVSDAPPPIEKEEIRQARLGELAEWVAMPTIAALAKVEQRGITLDEEWTRSTLAEEEKLAEEALDAICERYDLDRSKASTAATSTWFGRLTDLAVEEGELHVAAMTNTGKPQWSKSVLEKQARNGSETAELILQSRNGAKRAEFLRNWLSAMSKQGRVHATYNSGSVVTGRLSSSSPNMQQVTKALKPAFVPRDGYYLAEIDYSQIELRVAAHISQCRPMIDAFNRGDDLHRLLAAKIAHKKPEDVTPEERQKGKSANFGLLYGMGAYGFKSYAEAAYGVDMSEQEAQAIHTAFFEQWQGMREWHIRAGRTVKNEGQVVSPIGRIRRLPGAVNGDEREQSSAERNAINSPVQGFASDLMQMAAASIMGTMPGEDGIDGAHVVGTVHDSIVVELEADRWEEVLDECIERMTTGIDSTLRRMGCELSVPIAAEATVGRRWGVDDILADD